MGLLDQLQSFGQGASNSAASNVTAPVDGLAWLLRKMGVPVPSDPVGGSDWAAKQGLTATPKNHVAGLLGEAIGGVAPMLAAAKAPQIARGLLQMEANAAAPKTLNPQTGAIVWHGSPHKFDKFDSSKIGTGEGAQAYGHGLYLAESPDVAKAYRSNLVKDATFIEKKTGRTISKEMPEYADILETQARMERNGYGATFDKRYDVKEGGLYKVDLPDEHIAKMLDWDKPLSQQPPEVQKAVKPLLKDAFDVRSYGGGWGSLEPDANAVRDVFTKSGHPLGSYSAKDADALNFTGSAVVKALGNMDKESAQTSQILRKAGIPGIRYLDGGSRGAGQGSSNFVVFPGNEGLLSILERNGQSLK